MKRLLLYLLISKFVSVGVFAQQVYSFDGFPFGTSRSIIEAKHKSNVAKGISSDRLIEFNDQRYQVFEYVGEFSGFLPRPNFVKYFYDYQDRLIAGVFSWPKRKDWTSEDMSVLSGRIEKLVSTKYGIPIKYKESESSYLKYGYRYLWGLGDVGSIVLIQNEIDWISIEYSHFNMIEKHSEEFQKKHKNDF